MNVLRSSEFTKKSKPKIDNKPDKIRVEEIIFE